MSIFPIVLIGRATFFFIWLLQKGSQMTSCDIWGRVSEHCGSGGCPEIGRLVVPCPAVRVSKCPWAIRWTPMLHLRCVSTRECLPLLMSRVRDTCHICPFNTDRRPILIELNRHHLLHPISQLWVSHMTRLQNVTPLSLFLHRHRLDAQRWNNNCTPVMSLNLFLWQVGYKGTTLPLWGGCVQGATVFTATGCPCQVKLNIGCFRHFDKWSVLLFFWQGKYHISWHLAPIWIWICFCPENPANRGRDVPADNPRLTFTCTQIKHMNSVNETAT